MPDRFVVRVHSNAGPAGWLADPPQVYSDPSGMWQVDVRRAKAGVFDRATAITLTKSYDGTFKWRGPKARQWATMEPAGEEEQG